jgi:hypothetical protein
MAVPKAAVDKNDLSARPENEIGFTGQIRTMQPVAKTHAMDNLADQKLWLCAFAFYTPHIFGAASGRNSIHQT